MNFRVFRFFLIKRGANCPKYQFQLNQVKESVMKKMMAFLLGLGVIVVLTSCASVKDLTLKTTQWEMDMAKEVLGGNDNGAKASNEETIVSDNKATSPVK